MAQRNGGKASTKHVWKGRGWRREGGVRRKEEGGRRREGEKRTVAERGRASATYFT